ncbi:hypothetical protein Glove_299g92 [Diversispora epigaea]|uniref:Uncharacterized protein n=1 Tax=Diversispora epigaea TaxID=1348612 RepID=A0A397HXQ4_9GLOM|nr:hypothetical protein Glove_299g92 [Diversispora epigaea]
MQSKNTSISKSINNKRSTMFSFEVPIQKSREENNVVWFQDHVNNKSVNFETKKFHSSQFKFEEMVINETLGFLETLERETRPIPKFYAAKPEDLNIDTNAEVTEEIDNSINELSEDQNKGVKQPRIKRTTVTKRSPRNIKSPKSPNSPKSPLTPRTTPKSPKSPSSSIPKTPRTPKSPKSLAKRGKKQSDNNNWELNTNSVGITRKRKVPNQETRSTKRKGTVSENEKDISNKTPNGVDKNPEKKKRQYRRRVPTNKNKESNSSALIINLSNTDSNENVAKNKVNAENGKKRRRTNTKNSHKLIVSSTSSLSSLNPTPSITLSSLSSPPEDLNSPPKKS